MNAQDEVRSRRLTAFLEEAVGESIPAGLEQRVLQRVRDVPAVVPKDSARGRVVWLLAGVLVVALVTWLRSESRSSVVMQDPQPAPQDVDKVAEVTAATLRAALDPLAGAGAPGEAVDRLLRIAAARNGGVVVSSALTGDSSVDVADATWREAIERIAAERDVGLSEHGSVLVVGVGQTASTERARVTLDTGVVTVRDLLKTLHARCGVDVVVAAGLSGRVRVQVENVPWRTVLDMAAARLGLHVVGTGNTLALVTGSASVDEGRRVIVSQRIDPLDDLFSFVAKNGSRNLFVDRVLVGSAAFYKGENTTVHDTLLAFAALGRAEVQQLDPRLTRIAPRLANDAGISLTAENIGLRDLVQMSWTTLEPNVQIADGIDAKVAVFVSGALWFDVLRAAAAASGRQFLRTDAGYRIE